MPKSSTRKVLFYLLILLLLLLVGKFWYEWQQRAGHTKARKSLATAVQVARATSRTIPLDIHAVGELQAWRYIVVSPEIDGQVASIHFTPGALVRKGQLLVQLDARVYQADLQSAKAALRLAQANYRRYQALKSSGALSKQQLDQVRANFVEASAKVKSAQTYLSQATIRAPFDGYIGAKNISIGDYVKKGDALTTLTDRSLLIVNYHIPEAQLQRVKLGQPINVTIPKHKNNVYQGKVSYIAPTVSTDTHSVELQAKIPNSSNALSPGMFVKIRQRIGMVKQAVVVPQQSILPTITGSQVFVVRNNKAYAVKVKVGTIFDGKVEIRHGIKSGDVVVIAGQTQLKNGEPVREVNQR